MKTPKTEPGPHTDNPPTANKPPTNRPQHHRQQHRQEKQRHQRQEKRNTDNAHHNPNTEKTNNSNSSSSGAATTATLTATAPSDGKNDQHQTRHANKHHTRKSTCKNMKFLCMAYNLIGFAIGIAELHPFDALDWNVASPRGPNKSKNEKIQIPEKTTQLRPYAKSWPRLLFS